MLNVVMVKANAGGNDGAVVRIAISVPTGRRCRRRQRRRSIALVIIECALWPSLRFALAATVLAVGVDIGKSWRVAISGKHAEDRGEGDDGGDDGDDDGRSMAKEFSII